ncbi:MAG: hypothetical protein NZ585_06780 [Chloracidobacterium sp.]|nr:hypothetical protein [Chloracidobacterium sp.]MDW8218393.1 hypothetical protein [Acidobacteriota bacterium]
MYHPVSPQPREGLSTPAAVVVLLAIGALLVSSVGLTLYFLVSLKRTSSAGVRSDRNRQAAPAQPDSSKPPSRATSPAAPTSQTRSGGATTDASSSTVNSLEIQMGVVSASGDFIPQSSFPRGIGKIVCRVTVPSVSTSDIYSTYWYVDDAPGDRTGRLMCVIHGEPFTEDDVRYAQRWGGITFNHTMNVGGYPLLPGLYRVQVVRSGQKLRFVRFRVE